MAPDTLTPIGVLLINVGTPEEPTTPALRRYLAQFLGDRRVIDYPRWFWLPLLHGIILNIRPRRSAKLYRNIWTEQGSPLLVIMKEQAAGLKSRLAGRSAHPIEVEVGLSYGQPSIPSALDKLQAAGCRRILLYPLYPQYSGTTTAAGLDAAMAHLMTQVELPAIHWTRSYYQDEAYLQSLVQSIRDYWRTEGKPEKLLFSFHGIPERYERNGDPYREHCQFTADRVAAGLGLTADDWEVAYQSRFGPEPWLQPYTDEVIEAWAEQGVSSVHVVAPGFSADCLETIDEIDREYRDLFEERTSGEFRYIPALNNRTDHLEALAGIARTAIAGWLRLHEPSGPTRQEEKII